MISISSIETILHTSRKETVEVDPTDLLLKEDLVVLANSCLGDEDIRQRLLLVVQHPEMGFNALLELYTEKLSFIENESRWKFHRVQHLLKGSIDIIRLLRNLMAQRKSTQDLMREAEYLPQVFRIVEKCIDWKGLDDGAADSLVVLLARIGAQFGGNFVTGNEQNQQYFWQRYFPEIPVKILVEFSSDRKTLAASIALLHNCLFSQDTGAAEQRKTVLVNNRQLIAALLQRSVVAPVSNREDCANTDSSDVYLEWVAILFRKLLTENHLVDLLEATKGDLFPVTTERLILLRLIGMCIGCSEISDNISGLEGRVEAAVIGSNAIPPNAAALNYMVEYFVDLFSTLVSRRPGDEDANVQMALLQDAISVVSDIIGLYSALETINFEKTVRIYNDFVRTLVKMLSESTELFPEGFKSGVIRILGNLSYKNRKTQDLLRECDGIIAIMNHCGIDDKQPLMREWSLFALRNICERNAENQSFIQELQPQGVKSSLNLKNMGVHVEMGEGGRVKLVPNK